LVVITLRMASPPMQHAQRFTSPFHHNTAGNLLFLRCSLN
jgi:hypothetical protein